MDSERNIDIFFIILEILMEDSIIYIILHFSFMDFLLIIVDPPVLS